MHYLQHTLDESIDACNPAELDKLTREMHLARYNWVVKRLNEIKSKSGIHYILDAASGRGYGSCILSYVMSVVGVDICPEAVEYAKSKHRTGTTGFIQADLEEFKTDCPFDAVVCFETLEHCKNPRRVLRNLCDALRKDGIIFISVPNGKYERKNPDGTPSNPHHISSFTKEDLQSIVSDAGFHDISFFGQAQIYGFLMNYIRKAEMEQKAIEEAEIKKDSPLRKARDLIFKMPLLCSLLTEPKQSLVQLSESIIVQAKK